MMHRPEALRRRRAGQRRLGGADHLHAYRQHAHLRRRAEGVPRAHSDQVRHAYLPDKPNSYAASARTPRRPTRRSGRPIWPTRRSGSPSCCRSSQGDQLRLYTLIYNRFVASQMTPAVFAVTNVESRQAAEGLFKAQGTNPEVRRLPQVLVPAGKQEDTLLPALTQDQKLDLLELTADPALHRAAAALQRGVAGQDAGKGRHRPAQHLRHHHRARSRSAATSRRRTAASSPPRLGMKVTDLLVEHFPKVMDLQVHPATWRRSWIRSRRRRSTATRCSTSSTSRSPQALKEAETKMTGATREKCPQCGRPLVERFSRKIRQVLRLLGLSRIRAVQLTSSRRGRKGPAASRSRCKSPTEHRAARTAASRWCKRMGRRGTFLGCSGYPECKTTMNFEPKASRCWPARRPSTCARSAASRWCCVRAARPVPGLQRLSEVQERQGRRCRGQPGASRSTRASSARSAAAPMLVKKGRAVRSWAAAPIRSAAATSRCPPS